MVSDVQILAGVHIIIALGWCTGKCSLPSSSAFILKNKSHKLSACKGQEHTKMVAQARWAATAQPS